MKGERQPRVLVHQLGARLHYGAAKAIFAEGLLTALVTDLHLRTSSTWLKKTRLIRYASELPDNYVISDARIGCFYKAAMALSMPQASWPHLFASEELARLALDVINARCPSMIYGFDTAMLPLMRAVTARDPPLMLLEQCVVPRSTQMELSQKWERHLPLQVSQTARLQLAQLAAIEQQEWNLADTIVCPSTFVEKELVRWGCAPDKIHVLPYGFTPKKFAAKPKQYLNGPLRVLFVGTVGYRKGIHDLQEVSTRLVDKIRITALGTIAVNPQVTASLSESMDLRGPVSFESVVEAFGNAHVLVLPSYFEGSATAVYEALAHGLPCIVSRQTGSVITHNEDGLVIEAGDISALDAALHHFLDEPREVERMSLAAMRTARQYTCETYGAGLANIIRESHSTRGVRADSLGTCAVP